MQHTCFIEIFIFRLLHTTLANINLEIQNMIQQLTFLALNNLTNPSFDEFSLIRSNK